MDFSGHLWLEKTRIWIQGGFFTLFLAAFALSLVAFWKPALPAMHRRARGFWVGAMFFFVGMWALGTTLEMLRRIAHVATLWPLVLSIAAFSFLLAGVLVLMREWFAANGRIDGARVAWTLLLLTFAGWFFGGFSLEWNCLFTFAPEDYGRMRFPDGWILMLCGAQLLGAAKTVQSPHEPARRVLNPKPATWWLLAFSFFVAYPRFGDSSLAATAALCGFLPFLLKTWGARRSFDRRARGLWLVASIFIVLAPLLLWPPSSYVDLTHRVSSNWKSIYSLFFLLFVFEIALLCTLFRPSLRLTLQQRFSGRSLLLGCGFGSLASAVLFGPAGALFFAFWPLAGLFFDLLRVDDTDPSPLPEAAPDTEFEIVEAD